MAVEGGVIPPCMSQIELRFSCRKLKDLDIMGKSDSIVQVFLQNKSRKEGSVFIGQTEVICNNLNPDFCTGVVVDYYFEEEQVLILKVLDVDQDEVTFKDADYIGDTLLHLSKLVASPGQTLTQKLTHKSRVRGMIKVSGEELASSNQSLILDFNARNLINTICWPVSVFRTASPALTIQRSREDGEWVNVFKTEKKRNNLDPKWDTVKIKSTKLCNGDFDRPLRMVVYDESSSGSGKEMGCCEMSVNQMQTLDNSGCSLLSKGIKDKGQKLYVTCSIIREPSFLDYVRGGLQLNLHIAIDFTASNGNIHTPGSLHYLHPSQPNQYEQVIQSVGIILRDYDSDNMYPVYGFGGKLADGGVSHCFALDPAGYEVHDVIGVLTAYRQSLKNVQLAGPTLFGPILNQMISTVVNDQNKNNYHILLILTDGCIHDMQVTIDAIVATSTLPISIIIVGVGDADFTNMHVLDADNDALRASNGQKQVRDNVQFVPYNSVGGSASRLARSVLEELPQQVVHHYYVNQRIQPSPPTAAAPEPITYAHCPSGLRTSYLQRAGTKQFVQTNSMQPYESDVGIEVAGHVVAPLGTVPV